MPHIADSYSESNFTGTFTMYLGNGEASKGQSFTGDGTPITSAKFYLAKTGSPPNNITCELYAHTGTFGTDGKPTGSALATATPVSANSLSTSIALIEFTFPTPYTMAKGTNYCVAVTYNDGDVGNRVNIGYDGTSPTHGGNLFYSAAGTAPWVGLSFYDTIFYVYGGDIAIGINNLRPAVFKPGIAR